VATFVEKPAIIEAAGNKPKIIREFVGRVNTGTTLRAKSSTSLAPFR
jgi:hypothetical protein